MLISPDKIFSILYFALSIKPLYDTLLQNHIVQIKSRHFYAGTHKQWLRDRTDEAIAKGLPIFVSECAAMEASGDGPIDYKEWNKFVSWMDAKGLSWVAWSVSDKVETCSILNPSAASNGKWKKKDVKEWGVLTKAALTSYLKK